MFEFTEDKKSIRPKWVGTIESNWQRRTMMVLMLLPTMAVVIGFNLIKFVLYTLLAFARLVVYGTLKVIITPFLNWPYWHEPRRSVVMPLIKAPEPEPLIVQLMQEELKGLNEKLLKHSDHYQSREYKKLPDIYWDVYTEQWMHMMKYSMALEARIQIAKRFLND